MVKHLHPGLTFDDVLLEPHYSGFLRSEIDLKTKLTRNITINIPLVSSPMDTVTESKLAIALAKLGGIGFIHRNLTVDAQVDEVKKVKKKALIVGAAVGSSPGYEKRVKKLVNAGADVIIVDSAHGNAKLVVNTLRYIKDRFKVDVIAGNIATADGAKTLINAGADGLRVGMGPGAICSTRIISGMGVPQITALFATASTANRKHIPIIADGGINYPGDITKALAAGASSVMMGRIFAATNESPGKTVLVKAEHVPHRFKSILNGAAKYEFKEYRGMGSVAAMSKGIEVSSEDEFHGKSYKNDVLIAEGVEGLVPSSGSIESVIKQLTGSLQSGLYYTGSQNIAQLQRKAEFIHITQASLAESHPHDLFTTSSGANYNI